MCEFPSFAVSKFSFQSLGDDDSDALSVGRDQNNSAQGLAIRDDNPVDEYLGIVEISSELESTLTSEKRDHGTPIESMTKRKVEYICLYLCRFA